MIQTLWFFIKVALIVGIAVWLGTQSGSVSMSLMGYDLTVSAGVFLISLCLFILVILLVWRVVRTVFSVPEVISKHHEESKRQKGFRALTKGLVAIAAGDTKRASQFARQTKALMPGQNGLPVLLEAQAARLRGEEGLAQNRFEELMKDRDAGFLGVRGLLKSSLEAGQYEQALGFARQAEKLHPKQAWILKTVYELEIKNHYWQDVLETGKKALKIGALSQKRVLRDRVAIYLMRYDYDSAKGNPKLAIKELEQAYKIDPYFVPTVTRLAEHYISLKKNRKAASVIEKAWKKKPHPEMAAIWDRLAPAENGHNGVKILKWYEDLVALRPDSVEGQMAAARAAMGLGYWGEAKAYLMVAERIYPSVRVFQLKAIVEKNSTHNEDDMHRLMEKASAALPDKVWVCSETGLIYDEWSAIAMPHESFNTIIWDMPGARIIRQNRLGSVSDKTELLIEPAV